MHFILFYSGNPLPAMLEVGFEARKRGCDVDLILIDRMENDLRVDEALVNYPVQRIISPHNGVNFMRLFDFVRVLPKMLWALKRLSQKESIVITSSFDTLFVAKLFSRFFDIRIRHQVRDLHAIQLGSGLAAWALKGLERWLLKSVEMLIYSAPSFFDEYYGDIFEGQTVLLENLPQESAWRSFNSSRLSGNKLRIGYIGIIRYMSPLANLIDAVDHLRSKGFDCSTLFAGGGNSEPLKRHAGNRDGIYFNGPFEYTSQVADLHRDVDLIFAVYDRFDRNCQIAMPTKFYESLITRIPIVVSKDTYVGRVVEQMGIGVAVDGESVDELIAVLGAVFDKGSWYSNAKLKLEGLNIDRWYQSYRNSLEIIMK